MGRILTGFFPKKAKPALIKNAARVNPVKQAFSLKSKKSTIVRVTAALKKELP